MGAILLLIPCARTDPHDHDWAVIQRYLWNEWLLPELHSSLRDPEYRAALRYLENAAEGGFAEGDWCVDQSEMKFRFPDYGGTSHVSAAAGLHFVESLVAGYIANRKIRWIFSDDGWTLRPRAPKDVVRVDAPLIVLRGTLYLARTDTDGMSLSCDDGQAQLSMEELTAAERDAVNRAWKRHECACVLCADYRRDIEKERKRPGHKRKAVAR